MTKTVAAIHRQNKAEWWQQKAAGQAQTELKSETKQFQQITFKIGTFDDEARTFTAVGSTSVVDRQGDSVDQSGWILDNFIANPVIPWAHDYNTPPVGRAIEIGVNDKGQLQFVYQAPPEGLYDLADTVWNLYRNGFLFAFSVGFIPLEADGNWQEGYTFTSAELLEISAVVVPANPQALALAYKMDVISEKQAKSLRSKMTAATKALDQAINKTSTIEKEDIHVKKQLKKGAIADELDKEASAEVKWELMEQVYDIWWAFQDVWYDGETAVADFPVLLNELANLFMQVAAGDVVVPDDDDGETAVDQLGPVMHALQDGVDKDKVKAMIEFIKDKQLAKDGEGLTKTSEPTDNKDMTKSQKDALVEKTKATLSDSEKDTLKAMHAEMQAHLKTVEQMLGMEADGSTTSDDEDQRKSVSKKDANVVVEPVAAVAGDQTVPPVEPVAPVAPVAPVTPEVVAVAPVEEDGAKAEPVVDSAVEEDSNKEVSEDSDKAGEQGEVKSATDVDDGADQEEKGEVIDPNNLTDEQAEEVVRAVNAELELIRKAE
jgi:hypothetical protein